MRWLTKAEILKVNYEEKKTVQLFPSNMYAHHKRKFVLSLWLSKVASVCVFAAADSVVPVGRPRHPIEMNATATVGVLFGVLLLSWLVLGPAVCLAWRWNERRREKKKMLFR
jgi:hypothetical protein